MTQTFDIADRVRIAIADPVDPDAHHHGRPGRVVGVREDDYGTATDDPRDDYLYRVRFTDEDGGEMWFRHSDLRHEQH